MGDYCVYEHVNKVNNKVYIGITKCNVDKRWDSGRGYINNKDFYSDITRYGWNSFEHNILLTNLDQHTAESVESVLIYKLNTIDKDKGYNLICNHSLREYQPCKTIKRYKPKQSVKCVFEGMMFDSMQELADWLYKNNLIHFNYQGGYIRKWIEGKSKMPELLKNKEMYIV